MRSIAAIIVLLGLGLVQPVRAHPIPQLEFDRQITIELTPTKVVVDYRLEIDPFTLMLEVARDKARYKLPEGQLTREDFARAMQERLRKVVPDGLIGKFNDSVLKWTIAKDRVEFLDSVKFVFRFEAPLAKAAGKLTFQLEELNFPDKNGRLKLSLDPPSDAKILAYTEPVERKVVPLDNKRNLIRLEYELLDHSKTELKQRSEPPAEPVQEKAPDTLWQRLHHGDLAALLDSELGLLWLLPLAALFGAAHALTPGHGKTLVAAYLIGEQGTYWHALLLGLITTISHTGGVIAVAFALWVFFPASTPDSVRVLLSFVGGLMIAGLGLWLLLQRLAGKADHFHLPGIGHSHGSDSMEVEVRPRKASMTRLILLGITGGLIPCWDAILLLGVAISVQKIWLAVPLLLSFSAGLAAVLVAIGWGIVYAGARLGGRWAQNRFVKLLPILSSVLVIGIGIWLCKSAFSPAG